MDYTHVPSISCLFSDQAKNVFSKAPDTHSLLTSEAHFEYEVLLVTKGHASAIISHKTYDIGNQTLIFISRLERHSFLLDTETPYCRYVLTVSSDVLMQNVRDVALVSLLMQRPKEFCHAIPLTDAQFAEISALFELIRAECAGQEAFYITRSISAFVSILILLYRTHPESFPMRSKSNIQNLVLEAQRYVNDHFESRITLEEIAAKNFISRHTLSLAFKDIVGISFRDYLVLFRLTEAKKLLITTDLSVDEISEKTGYQNVNNFIQTFKSREKLTPLQYRKQYCSRTDSRSAIFTAPSGSPEFQ